MAAKNLKLQVAEKQNHQETLVFVEELKRQWMATIDALVDPLMIVSPEYEIIKANKAMAGFANQSKVQSLIGKKCYEVFAGKKKPCDTCRMPEAVKSSEPLGFELSLSQNTRHFEVTSQPFYNAANKLDGVVQVYRDRTEAKLLAEQLSQSEKLASIGLLAGGIAHEINNPLGGILVFTQMLLRELPKNSSGYLDAKEIEQAALRCKEIVESLLEFARTQPQNKSPKKEYEQVDVRTAVEQAVSFIKMGFDLQSFDLSVNLNEQLNTIRGDKNKLIQVLLNLLQNAVQAMPKGGKISISSYPSHSKDVAALKLKLKDSLVPDIHHEYLTIEVKDKGTGIEKEHLKKIFDPFFTTKDIGKGTGLGLAICYGIISEFGGDIQVQSQPKKGSCFKIILPVE